MVGLAAACSSESPQRSNVEVATTNSNNLQTVSSHTTEKALPPAANSTVVPKSDTKTKWTQSGNPIDTSKFDAGVVEAEKNQKAKPSDAAAKKDLAEAFVARGVALTDARQYASALGDYRRALKLDPNNEEARKWIDQIIAIYTSINREYPPEGEEPPPLPFKKEA